MLLSKLTVRLRHLACNILRSLATSESFSQVDCERKVTLFRFLTRTGKMWDGKFMSSSPFLYILECVPPNKVLAVECWDAAQEVWDLISEFVLSEEDLSGGY